MRLVKRMHLCLSKHIFRLIQRKILNHFCKAILENDSVTTARMQNTHTPPVHLMLF